MGSGSSSAGVNKKINMHVAELNKSLATELLWIPKRKRGILRKIWGLFFWVSNKYDYDQLFQSLASPDFCILDIRSLI